MARKKSLINFDKTIAGINITERGVKSYSKTIKVGPFQVTANLSEHGIRGSLGLPGTGISFRNVVSTGLPDFRTPDLPEHNSKPDMWSDNE
jgi:hypothetical protein|tara:strand:- start:2702 stop:2974 length:273 start_codon:yes stop_codon:yes gene_type:complete